MNLVQKKNTNGGIITEVIFYIFFFWASWYFLTPINKYHLYFHTFFYVSILAGVSWWVIILLITFLLKKRQKKLGKPPLEIQKIWPLYVIWFCIGITGKYTVEAWVIKFIGLDISTFAVFCFTYPVFLQFFFMFIYLRIKILWHYSLELKKS
jgi:uncharacterized protein YacL